MRQLPDGRPLEIIVENSGESTEQSDVLELIRDSWRRVGIRLFAKPSQLTLFRRRVFSGETLMSIDKGIENGLAPPHAALGIRADHPAAARMAEMGPVLRDEGQGRRAAGSAVAPCGCWSSTRRGSPQALTSEHARIWHEMLQIWADEVFSIGTVAGVLQPVVVNDRLRNVPEQGIYNWDPGAHFGIYKPDGFWFDLSEASAKSASATISPPGASIGSQARCSAISSTAS